MVQKRGMGFKDNENEGNGKMGMGANIPLHFILARLGSDAYSFDRKD